MKTCANTIKLKIKIVTNPQMTKTISHCATCLPVLVLVEGHSIGAVLVMIDTVFPLLAKFEVLAECPLHHHVLAVSCADTGDVTLCIHYEYLCRLQKKIQIMQIYFNTP